MSKTVAMAGASGVVGRRGLEHLLSDANVARVLAVGRRPLTAQHAKLVSIVADLNNEQDLLAKIPAPIDVAVCALGTTMKQAGSKEGFRRVDHDAVLTFAQAARVKGATRLVLISSIGANVASGNFYLRTKGETEADLAKLGYANLTILRPSFIDDQGTRGDHRLGERLALPLARALFAVIGKHSRYAPITADTLGKAVLRLAFDDANERVRILEGKSLFEAGR